ncbi:MAG: hypothetical protein WB608_19960 [Terracidiphilus sp.]
MRLASSMLVGLAIAAGPAFAQGGLTLPGNMKAGDAFSIQSTGSGNASLYIVGPDQVLKRDIHLGEAAFFVAGTLYNAGHYQVFLAGSSSAESGSFDVLPAKQPDSLSFLARPSRLQVGLHDGITGAVYVFDAYHNLIESPMAVTFELSNQSGPSQTRTVQTRDGAAWTAMDSTTHQGIAHFVARAGGVSSTRVIEQVPGDPCGLKMNARQAGPQLQLETDPVRDCSGNAVPDGTIVTFTEAYDNSQSTVDVPLKRGVAKVDMPARQGATISVASGVVLGNQIRWER